jgi:hypothetical protein
MFRLVCFIFVRPRKVLTKRRLPKAVKPALAIEKESAIFGKMGVNIYTQV